MEHRFASLSIGDIAFLYNYHLPRSSGIRFSQATEGNASTGLWYVQIKPSESSSSVGGDYTNLVDENTTSDTIILNQSHPTTEEAEPEVLSETSWH